MGVILWVTRATQAESVRTLVFSASPAMLQARLVLPAAVTPKADSQEKPRTVAIQKKATRAGHFILWDSAAIREDGSYDVIIHFHGIPQALEPALAESGLHAFLLVIEAGLVTGDYRNAYGMAGTLDRLLKAMRERVSEIAGRPMHEARVAASSWSAGSGAILPMLRRPSEVDRLDAVVFSDGLHSSFIEPRTREIHAEQLEPVRSFAAEAIAGRKFFGLSHTAIQTVDYASTTETATRLLSLLQVAPTHVVDPTEQREPVVATRAELGAMSVLGFGGQDTRAHGRQQWAIGRVLWSALAARWNRK